MSDIGELNESQISQSPYLASNASISNLVGSANAANSSSSPSTGSGSNSTSQVADVNAFITYMKQFVPALLDANLASLSDFEKCMNEKTTTETIKKFLGETQVRTLIIQKFILKGKQ